MTLGVGDAQALIARMARIDMIGKRLIGLIYFKPATSIINLTLSYSLISISRGATANQSFSLKTVQLEGNISPLRYNAFKAIIK